MKQLNLFNEINEITNKWSQHIFSGWMSGLTVERMAELTKLPIYTIHKILGQYSTYSKSRGKWKIW
jgi:hypothetical protein